LLSIGIIGTKAERKIVNPFIARIFSLVTQTLSSPFTIRSTSCRHKTTSANKRPRQKESDRNHRTSRGNKPRQNTSGPGRVLPPEDGGRKKRARRRVQKTQKHGGPRKKIGAGRRSIARCWSKGRHFDSGGYRCPGCLRGLRVSHADILDDPRSAVIVISSGPFCGINASPDGAPPSKAHLPIERPA